MTKETLYFCIDISYRYFMFQSAAISCVWSPIDKYHACQYFAVSAILQLNVTWIMIYLTCSNAKYSVAISWQVWLHIWCNDYSDVTWTSWRRFVNSLIMLTGNDIISAIQVFWQGNVTMAKSQWDWKHLNVTWTGRPKSLWLLKIPWYPISHTLPHDFNCSTTWIMPRSIRIALISIK